MAGRFLRLPQSCATRTESSILNTPLLRSSQRMALPCVSGVDRSSFKNCHKWMCVLPGRPAGLVVGWTAFGRSSMLTLLSGVDVTGTFSVAVTDDAENFPPSFVDGILQTNNESRVSIEMSSKSLRSTFMASSISSHAGNHDSNIFSAWLSLLELYVSLSANSIGAINCSFWAS